MSKFSRFMKQNKVVKENVTYPATKSLTDEHGNPLKWVIKPLSTKESEILREECTIDVPVTGKPNMLRPKLQTSKYITKLVCACIVEPNLYDVELQDSYGVKTPEDLLREMVDNPGEFNDLVAFVQKNNGFDTSLEDKVEEAKN